ncbi:phospho-N-acetylmuramoyl-pentapeptide-transferase [Pectinatus frisingensis]|jgi:phospho-N-acetylmuramoyl-pentapeptide-transferase|uniref:phospho-N-acetylmuramoyl-pentapeptide- transferase n=1 Tax=Pectinatus frisingensis TaxID=865 RepID=UPI0018C5D123|nr:phospho-N-acetylmuramoyl-pentapeptide-transferase [Pectinatus frisingensis]
MMVMIYPVWAAILSAAVVLLCGPKLIPELHKLKFGQSIRQEGPKSHQIKSGTPTMGGIIIVLGILVGTLTFAHLTVEILLALLITLGYFIIGFIDDYIKVVLKRNLGLTARQKFLGQLIIALLATYLGIHYGVLDMKLWLPLLNININLGFFYYILIWLVLVGTTNAVNLTDGLDGLAAGSVAITSFVYALICLYFVKFDLAILCLSCTGALVAFLKFNKHPAQIFMGDTGSLALGGVISSVAILTHTEILLILIGGLFVIEALSVIIQVVSFHCRHGKRVFLMSPLHHHFELKGWPEVKVVRNFWLISALCGFSGLIILLLS